tara:strand:+ start:466 stop:696 length:231 start_codon:yes stop_codon:yes gene_type:complete
MGHYQRVVMSKLIQAARLYRASLIGAGQRDAWKEPLREFMFRYNRYAKSKPGWKNISWPTARAWMVQYEDEHPNLN